MMRTLLALCCLFGCSARPPELPIPQQPLALTDEAAFAARPPAPTLQTALEALEALELESTTLANGLTVWVVHHLAPSVAVRLVSVPAEAACGPEVLHLTARALARGGLYWSDGSIVEAPMINGRAVSFEVSGNSVQLSLLMVRPALNVGLDVLSKTVLRPALVSGFERERLAEVAAAQHRGDSISRLLWRLNLSGAYGKAASQRLLGDRVETLKQLSLEHVAACYGTFRPNASALILVGNIRLAEVLPRIQQSFGEWALRDTVSKPAAAWPNRIGGRRVHFLPQSDGEVASAFLIQNAPSLRARADEAAFQVLAEIAAGSFRSRANLRWRHEAGATYGVRLLTLRTPDVGVFGIYGTFENSSVISALDDLLQMFEALREREVSGEELRDAQVGVLTKLAQDTSSTEQLGEWLATAFSNGRSIVEQRGISDQIARVTAQDVHRVANTYLTPDHYDVALAGPSYLETALGSRGALRTYSVHVRK